MRLHNHARRLFVAAVFTCLAAFPAFAAESKQECREEAAAIRVEIQELRDEIEAVRAENTEIAERYRAIAAGWRESRVLPDEIDEETWNQAREIHKEIKPIRDAGKADNVQIEQGAYRDRFQSGDYDAALDVLEQRLKNRKNDLKTVQEINGIWKQVDELLGGVLR